MTPATVRSGPAAWELFLVEWRLGLRTASFRGLTLFLIVVGVMNVVVLRFGFVAFLQTKGAIGVGFTQSVGNVLLFLTPLLVCGVAVRDQRMGMSELVLSKPPSSEALAWSRFLGIYAVLITATAISAIAAWIAQAVLLRGEYAAAPLAIAVFRIVGPLLFLSGLSYAAGSFFRNVMVAGVLIAFQFALSAGASLLLPAMQFRAGQYQWAYGLVGLAVAAISIAGWERRRDTHTRIPASIAAAALALGVGVFSGGRAIAKWNGASLAPAAVWDPITYLDKDRHLKRTDDRLPTAGGEEVRLSRWPGKPIVAVVWSTGSAGSAAEAAPLERAWRETAADTVGYLSICRTDDPVLALDLGRAAGLKEPIVINPLPEADEAIGLDKSLGGFGGGAAAAIIWPDGQVQRGVPVVRSPGKVDAPSPQRLWEAKLYETAKQAFPKIGERWAKVQKEAREEKARKEKAAPAEKARKEKERLARVAARKAEETIAADESLSIGKSPPTGSPPAGKSPAAKSPAPPVKVETRP